jgi:hypothetical protein
VPKAKVEPVRSVDVAERRARLVRRHLLAVERRVTTPEAVADALVVLHATDPSTVYLSVGARTTQPSTDDVTRALHADRTLRKVLCMRRTLFATPAELVPVVAAAAGRAVAVKERKSLALHLAWAGVADPDVFLDAALDDAEAGLRALGEVGAQQLGDAVPRLQQQVDPAPGKPYGGPGRITTRILTILALEGRAVRGRPQGGITSSLTRWEAAPPGTAELLDSLDTATAQAELTRRYVAAFGPVTDADVAWWIGITLGQARAALAALDVVPVDIGVGIGWVLADDVDPEPGTGPSVALLPGLDPTPMGWTGRDWYLGGHKESVFDRSGNVGPTVWVDGRIAGGWAQRPDGRVVWRLLEDVGRDATGEIAERAAAMEAFLGAVRVKPRFGTPLEKELMRGGS